MKIVTNSRLIERNSKIGKYSSVAALIILGIGLYISFARQDLFLYSLGALALGFILSQVGMHFGNRWGRSPRPDEIIDKSLKGLGREFIVYHYVTAASHLLVGPAGIYTLHPYHQSGEITYDKKRWRSRGGGFLLSYLRLFGQENMGRPDYEVRSEAEGIRRQLTKLLPEGTQLPEINALLIFTSPKAILKLENPPLPAITPKEIKDFMKRRSSPPALEDPLLSTITDVFPKADRDS